MFPGASSGDVSTANYAIYGAPLETSTSFYPGTRFGPERIRHFARGFEDYDHETDQHFSELGVIDCGDLRGWQDPEAYLAFLDGEVDMTDGMPILLGGEHTVSLAGVRSTSPDLYVCIDAHLDLRASFDGDPWSHATTTHHVLDEGPEVWVIGARSGTRDEWERAGEDDRITVIEPEGTAAWIDGMELEQRTVYVSIDIDGIDPAFAPGTGTSEPFGLSPRTVRRLIEVVAPHAVGADIVEVNDRDEGQAATLAAKLVRRLIFAHAASIP